MIARLSRTWVHKVPPLLVQPGDLKNVDDVVHVLLVQAPGQHRAGQVGVALEVVGAAGEHGVDIGVAAGAEQVVDAAAVLVGAVPREGVLDDGGEGPHVGEVGPEAIMGRDVRGVELLGAAGPEAFAGIVEVPDV